MAITPRWSTPRDRPQGLDHLLKSAPEGELWLGLHAVDVEGGERGWLLVSTHRALLARDQGRATLDLIALKASDLSVESRRFKRDLFVHRQIALAQLPRFGSSRESELFALCQLAPAPRRLKAARLLIEQEGDYHLADVILAAGAPHAESDPEPAGSIEALEDELSARSPLIGIDATTLDVSERVLIWRARCAIAVGAQHRAIDHLVALSARRPQDDLIASTSEIGQRDARWWLPIALAHEEAGDHVSAASVYALLHEEHPTHAGFLLSQARCLSRARRASGAIEAYERYVARGALEARTRLSASWLAPQPGEESAEEQGGARADLLDACEELGELHAQRADWVAALNAYLSLVRHDPVSRRGYELMLTTLPYLEHAALERAQMAQAMGLLELLDPRAYRDLAQRAEGLPRLNPRSAPAAA